MNGIAIHLLIHGRILPSSQLPINPINTNSNISPLPCTYRTSISLPYHPYLPTPRSNPEAFWGNGTCSFHHVSPDLKGGGRRALIPRVSAEYEKWAIPHSVPQMEEAPVRCAWGEKMWSSELESEMQEGGCNSCRGKAPSPHILIPSGWQLYNQTGQELEL